MDISIKGKNKTFHLKEIKWQMNKYYNIILLPSLHFNSKSIISPSQHTLFNPQKINPSQRKRKINKSSEAFFITKVENVMLSLILSKNDATITLPIELEKTFLDR